MTVGSLLRKPSAFIPLTMSLLALGLIGAVLVGALPVTPTGDEGTLARIFQLLLLLQLPVVATFALKWLPQARPQALMVLALHLAGGLAAIGTIVWLEW